MTGRRRPASRVSTVARMTRLDGKVAIITGGARGQGAATARLFSERGAIVYITDIDQTAGPDAAAEAGARVLAHDVTEQQSWTDVVEKVLGDTGRIDVLINNAGIIEWLTMTKTPLEVWN